MEDATAGPKAVDCTEEVLSFFKNVGVDGNIAYDLEFCSVGEWRVGCTDQLGKGVEIHDVKRLCVEGKGDAGSRRTKYFKGGIVFGTDKVDGIV
jgi:hypothetical protein